MPASSAIHDLPGQQGSAGRDIASSARLANQQRLSERGVEPADYHHQGLLGALAADLVHDVNQPLSAAATFLAAGRILLARDGYSARVGEAFRLGEEQVLQAGQTLQELRHAMPGRVASRRIEPVGSAIRQAAARALFSSTPFDIRLTCRLDPELRTILVDAMPVQEIVATLVRSAMGVLRREPGPAAREIAIGARLSGEDRVEIAVSHSGPNIPDGIGEQSNAGARPNRRTSAGVALSLCRTVVEAHGGSVIAQISSEGRPAIRFTMPTSVEEEE